MTDCNNTTTVADLPTCTDVSRDSYLIVQGENQACKVKVSDLVLGNENVDFYDQIQALVQQVNDLTSVIQANSGTWNDTTTVVNTNKTTWDQADQITTLNTVVNNNQSDWTDTAALVAVNSANWQNTYLEVDANKGKWTYGYDTVFASQSNWNKAYTIAVEGTLGAIHEAFETISTAPWWLEHSSWGTGTENTGPTKAQMYETWYHHQQNHDNWDDVYTTVKQFSSTWE